MIRRLFTLEEATGALPWLESKFQEMDPIRERLHHLEEQLVALVRRSLGNGGTSVGVQIHEAQKDVEGAGSQMAKVVEDINERGIIVRDVNMGLVDFPTLREGLEVYLCWVRGEGPIQNWHGANEGYGSRKPL